MSISNPNEPKSIYTFIPDMDVAYDGGISTHGNLDGWISRK
jgi:hypothetical protein